MEVTRSHNADTTANILNVICDASSRFSTYKRTPQFVDKKHVYVQSFFFFFFRYFYIFDFLICEFNCILKQKRLP